MNTSEVLDLSKENIQPLKQGRNAAKLGTALQAQTNSELHQKLLAEREQYELLIRMYEGDDPLQPHYDYVKWIEQSFPKHGPESNLGQILENTLTAFKDDERYKQDLRYAELLLKYIDTQPNPLEIYQLVYDQGLCTMCAPLYKAWADELDKNDDFKNADRIFELGKKVKAQPIDLLQEAHLHFQLSFGRRMLGKEEDSSSEQDQDYNRQALHKLQKKNIHSAREPVGAPGRVKQTLTNHNNQNAPFKVYQCDDDNGHNANGDGFGKTFPRHKIVHKENSLKPGPWTQQGGKIRNRGPAPANSIPSFQVHEDEMADVGSRHPKTPTAPGALKTRKKDNFTCPLAVFESPDPTKKPMYCKNKVYAGGREFQFEELRAALYNRRYDQLMALRKSLECTKQEIKQEEPEEEDNEIQENIAAQNNEPVPSGNTVEKPDLESPAEKKQLYQQLWTTPDKNCEEDIKPVTNAELLHKEDKVMPVQAPDHNKVEPLFENKSSSLETNTSLFHSQSFTVNTKEAMNVVQEMWNSPSPSPAFARNLRASIYPKSPEDLDESKLFKVPAVPPPVTPTPSVKAVLSFPIYSDEEPPPLTKPSQPFQIYSDEPESNNGPTIAENKEISASGNGESNAIEKKENSLPLQMFQPVIQPPKILEAGHMPDSDTATMKMLAFDSFSDEDKAPAMRQHNPAIDPPVMQRPYPLLPPAFHEEYKFEDVTCNTKAFDFVLPSSTPLVGHLKPPSNHQDKNCINGSFIGEEVKKCNTKQDLSMIFEASKERYSSSSGSSGCKTQGSVCTVGSTSTHPIQPEANDIEKNIGLLNISEQLDPFSEELIERLLTHIGFPKKHHMVGLHRFETDAPVIHVNSTVKLDSTKYSIVGELGKGSYARVLKATRDGETVALKQQKPAWQWEWYIVQELQNRLPTTMMDYYLHMSNGYLYKNSSILESEWAQFGTILSVVNTLKIAGKTSDLHLALYFSIQMMSIVEHLHKCKIIHGDIKPDNFVLYSLPKADLTHACLKLIDFGRSIDMTLFPEGTAFTTVVTTDGFQCNEMKDGRQWTYQTDLYGLAGCIYLVLLYDYMKVMKKGSSWQLSQKIPRYMKPTMWEEIFHPLLNVESCESLPDLKGMRESLEKHYHSLEQGNSKFSKLNNLLLQK